MIDVVILTIAILGLAVLYSSVGHAGASGYLAAMALVGLAPEEMRPTALVLNIFVALIGTFRFSKAGHFSWSTLWPFALGALPLAFLGGRIELPAYAYKPLVGVVLLVAGVLLIRKALGLGVSRDAEKETKMPATVIALLVGGGIGILAGLTGTGGGIFLSPVLVLCSWASPKRTAGVTVVFVLLTSISALTGWLFGQGAGNTAGLGIWELLPDEVPIYLGAAIVGGIIGSGLGAKKLGSEKIRLLLGFVLLIASAKMFITLLN